MMCFARMQCGGENPRRVRKSGKVPSPVEGKYLKETVTWITVIRGTGDGGNIDFSIV